MHGSCAGEDQERGSPPRPHGLEEIAVFLLVSGVILLLFAAPFALRMYLERLPAAPDCPSCGTTTCATNQGAIGSFVFAALAATTVCECGGCGWRGRMRWRWSLRRLRRRQDG